MSKIKTILLVLVLPALVLLAGFFRFGGITYGYPFLYPPDEPFLTLPAIRIAAGNFNPHWFGSPGSTIIYFLAGVFWIFNKISGQFLHGFKLGLIQNFQYNQALFHIVGRFFIALSGTASIFLVYLISRRIFNRIAGLLAALFLTFSVLSIEYSDYIHPDVPMTFFLLLVALFSVNIYKSGRLRDYVLAGIFLGLAIATKYPAVIGLIMILTSYLLRYWKKLTAPLKYLLFSGLIALLIFSLVTPFFWIDFNKAIHDVLWETRSEHAGADSYNFFQNLWFYLSGPLNWGNGGLILFFSVIGFIWALKRRNQKNLILAVFSLTFLIFISALSLHWNRWIIPLLAFQAIWAGFGFTTLMRLIKSRPKQIILMSIILILIITAPAIRSIRQLISFRGQDTRSQAETWIMENLPENKKIIKESYTPGLKNYSGEIINKIVVADTSLTELKKQNINYIITSSYQEDRVRASTKWPGQISNYDQINKTKLLKEFSPHQKYPLQKLTNSTDLFIWLNQPWDFKLTNGPIIKIFEVND